MSSVCCMSEVRSRKVHTLTEEMRRHRSGRTASLSVANDHSCRNSSKLSYHKLTRIASSLTLSQSKEYAIDQESRAGQYSRDMPCGSVEVRL